MHANGLGALFGSEGPAVAGCHGGEGEEVGEMFVGDFEREDVRLPGVFEGVAGAVPVCERGEVSGRDVAVERIDRLMEQFSG